MTHIARLLPVRGIPAALLGTALLVAAMPVAAQDLPTLEPEDYDRWETIGATELSPDGRWVAVTITRVEGDGELRIREVDGDSTHVVAHASRPAFSSDARWLAYSISHSEAERERLTESGAPVRSKVALMNLATGVTTVLEDVSDFHLSADGSYIALYGYAGSGGRSRPLIVRDLDRGINTTFGNVAEAEWQDSGGLLAMVIHGANRAGNGIRTYDPATGVIRTLESDTAEYTGLSWRDDSDDLAVMRILTHEDYAEPTHTIIAWRDVRSREPEREVLDPLVQESFPIGSRIVEHYALRWSDDGSTIFVGLREWTPESDSPAGARQASGDAATDTAGVDVWRSDDLLIVPEREVQARFDRSRSWLAAWRIDSGRFIPLADSAMQQVTLSDGRFAIGLDPSPYARERMFGPEYRDLIAIDVTTGERTRFAEHVQFHYGVSPGGRYMLYVRDGDYIVYDTRSGRETNVTAGLPTSFVNLQDDHTVEEKPPYGTGGWTTGDESVLLYDRYDIWEVRPDGSGAVRLTDGAADRIRHRRMWLSVDDRIVDRTKPVYVTIYGDRTKQYGYARILPDGRTERLLLLDKMVTRLTKADSADVFMYRIEGFDDSPDMFVAGPRLADAVQVTETNPFQSEYAWGHSHLIDFRNATGDELQAALFYPADYQPGRTYPMIVDIYEITSNTVHTYSVPSERTPYNTTVFTQNGYFVLRPDIVYRARDPGVSAVEALLPAVETVLDRGAVERERIGLIGHSWGGYQTAFAVTQTDLFSAAVAGAPLTDMISMYLSIFWNTGMTDARIFEIDQGRMEVPFWEDLDAYMRNSPLFSIQQLNTPLLVAFGDEDGAVDWHQGIELYNAARRAGKDMVMLVYEGENHTLASKANQVDYHRRILEWFEHYLQDGPAPEWIVRD
ncbi:MAG TPA: prolyl oligopeptidase family serine peptidase [Longimicrobiales bacterium]|nr:prolyl oligopeptidase family serine peptidase [Longimicrobiales bacterium]